MLVNKCAFTGSSFDGGIIFIQNTFTFLLACLICRVSPSFRFEPSWPKFKLSMPCIVFFVGTLVFSARALSMINVPTFFVFKNSSSILVAALEHMSLHKMISRPEGLFLLLSMTASLFYGWNDMQFSFWGYVFVTMHGVCIALYMVCVKKLNVEFSSSLELSIYSNAGSLPILFIIAMYEYQSSSSVILIQNQGCAAASVLAPQNFKPYFSSEVCHYCAGTCLLFDLLERSHFATHVLHHIVDGHGRLHQFTHVVFELRHIH
jgi:drug/metabolite transporter (DMT)-like permease